MPKDKDSLKDAMPSSPHQPRAIGGIKATGPRKFKSGKKSGGFKIAKESTYYM